MSPFKGIFIQNLTFTMGVIVGTPSAEENPPTGKEQLLQSIQIDEEYTLHYDIDDGVGVLCKIVKIKGA